MDALIATAPGGTSNPIDLDEHDDGDGEDAALPGGTIIPPTPEGADMQDSRGRSIDSGRSAGIVLG
eukprot:2755444-Pyramimonas_sp.AAC.1